MNVKAVPIRDFDLAKTLNSGQVFHWESCGDGYLGTIGDEAFFVEQAGKELRINAALVTGRPEEDRERMARAAIRHYFALDHQLTNICRSFPDDPPMNAAADYCRGLRIIRQPKWECLATFICSSMKQVAHIRQISQALRKQLGEVKQIDSRTLYTFPSANRVAECSETNLRKCGIGYRAKNLRATAELVASGEAQLEDWRRWPDAELRARLCALPGVGPKVANCVMLFAFQRLRAFPIDVWIERVLRERYFAGKPKPSATVLRAFSADYFGPYGGYAQQYLFHHARTGSQKTDR